jgi:lipoate-protein ligase A
MGSASLKVSGGKLINASVEMHNGSIISIQFTGDFFLHPEELIEVIESSLIGKRLGEDDLTRTIDQVLKGHNAQLIGASSQDFARVIMEASQ